MCTSGTCLLMRSGVHAQAPTDRVWLRHTRHHTHTHTSTTRTHRAAVVAVAARTTARAVDHGSHRLEHGDDEGPEADGAQGRGAGTLQGALHGGLRVGYEPPGADGAASGAVHDVLDNLRRTEEGGGSNVGQAASGTAHNATALQELAPATVAMPRHGSVHVQCRRAA